MKSNFFKNKLKLLLIQSKLKYFNKLNEFKNNFAKFLPKIKNHNQDFQNFLTTINEIVKVVNEK